MTPTRTAAFLFAIALAGCNNPASAPPAAPGKPAPMPVAGGPAPTPAVAPADQPVETFAKAFFTAVAAGTATPAMLTPEFKKIIAESTLGDDKTRGYSDDAAGRWLEKFKGVTPPKSFAPDAATSDTAVFGLIGSTARLRAVKLGGTWLADWFSVGPAAAPAGGDVTARFAAAAFFDGLLGKDDMLAAGRLTPAFKAALAPPFASDKSGFNRGILGSKLAEFRGGFDGYTITKADPAGVTGELTKGTAKKAFTLTLADRLVSGITIAE